MIAQGHYKALLNTLLPLIFMRVLCSRPYYPSCVEEGCEDQHVERLNGFYNLLKLLGDTTQITIPSKPIALWWNPV